MSTAGAERLKQSMGMEGVVVMFDSRTCGLALGETLGAGVEQPPTFIGSVLGELTYPKAKKWVVKRVLMAVPDWIWVVLMLSVEVQVSTEPLVHRSPDHRRETRVSNREKGEK